MEVEGNEDLSSALDESYDLLQCVEKLPPELMDRIITAALFSEPLGSHAALHTLESLSREWRVPILKRRITVVFESLSLRNQIQMHWQLCPEIEYDKHRQCINHQEPRYDLASWTISNCPHRCFNLLLDHGSVQASSYGKTGENLLYLAMMNAETNLVEHMVSLMDPKHLLQPYSLYEFDGRKGTILHISTKDEACFKACWKQAKLLPVIGTSSFGLQEIACISRFANIELAQELYHRGVDLGRHYPEGATHGWWAHEFPGWWGVLAQENPIPMLEWFWRQGHRPPESYLLFVVSYSLVAAAGWVLRQTQSYQIWRDAAYIAAENTDSRSVEMLKLIQQHRKHGWRTCNSFTQDVVIKVIEKVCDEIRSRRFSCLGESSQINSEESQISGSPILQLEKDAVSKIQYLRGVSNGIGVLGLKIKTRRAGLHQLTAALENMDS